MLDLSFLLHSGGETPLYQQLYAALAAKIRSGALRPGDKLPGKRSLAGQLAVAINTVDTAYQMLVAEGYLEARPKSGFYVLEYTDLLISEGFIEPHFFAGFSGGRKSVLPGIASRETVLANHCAEFVDHPKARTGVLEGNPIHADMLFAAKAAKLIVSAI